MKKILALIALSGLLAVGCTRTDHLSDSNGDGKYGTASGSSSYLSISVVSPSGISSRAVEDEKYESGTKDENTVQLIRFFFFNSDGNAVPVVKNPDKTAAQGKDVYDSFYDWTPNGEKNEPVESTPENQPTIEKIVYTTVVLNGPVEDDNPALQPNYVIAVVNPTDDVRALVDPSAAEVKGHLRDFKVGENEGKFVMSNSVYADGTTLMDCVDVSGNIFPTIQDAEKTPAKIYVERVVARLDLEIPEQGTAAPAAGGGTAAEPAEVKGFLSASENGYKDADAKYVYYTGVDYNIYSDGAEEGHQSVFVKLLGWTVTTTPKKSSLVKTINPEWPDDLFGSIWRWNTKDYSRSFWAINPSLKFADSGMYGANASATDYEFFSYNQVCAANKIRSIEGSTETIVADKKDYMQENAAEYNANGTYDAENSYVRPGYESKVIIAAQLVDEDGNPITVAEYGGKYYGKDELLKYLASMLEFTAGNEKISEKDLAFKTQAQYTGDTGVEVPGGYFSYVVLSEAGEGKTWKYGDATVTSEYVNSFIADKLVNHVLLWDEGMTYYFFPIRHLGENAPAKYDDGNVTDKGTPGYYGVVRNHIYRANVTKLSGLGTPVLDPDEPIYPEEPDRDGHMMAAEINILQWRVVSQDYILSW